MQSRYLNICTGVIPKELVLFTETPAEIRNCTVSIEALDSTALCKRVSPVEDNVADKSTPRSTRIWRTSTVPEWNSSKLWSSSYVPFRMRSGFCREKILSLRRSGMLFDLHSLKHIRMAVFQGGLCCTYLRRSLREVEPFCKLRHRNNWCSAKRGCHSHLSH